MRVLLVDDEYLALEMIEGLLKKIDEANIEILGKFTNPQKAWEALKTLAVDVVFLDMEMGPVHGLQLAEEIMDCYPHIQIIFITAHAQFALEAFEVNAIDYLLKPIRRERLEKAVQKVKERLVEQRRHERAREDKLETNPRLFAMGSFKFLDTEQKLIKWRTRKVQELFVFLWHHRGDPVHKARVIEELWPDMDTTRAVRLMHTTIYQLRKTLKDIGIDQAIKLVNDHYMLTSSIASDVEEIETIIHSEQISVKNIQKLLTLYSGEYLAEEDYQWTIQKQKELREKVLYFFEEFVLDETNRIEQPLLTQRCLEKMVQLDPYNESYILCLLDYYAEIKNPQKLIEFYAAMKKMFEEELDVDLPVNVQQVYQDYVKNA